MNTPAPFAELAAIAAAVERDSVSRLFQASHNETPNNILEGLATFAAGNERLRIGSPNLVDDLAHLLADDQDLLSRAYIEKRRTAEIAIELFVSAGYITKAATLARAYRKATGKLYSIHSSSGPDALAVGLSRELLWALLIQDPEALSTVTDALGSAVRDARTVVDEARYLSVAHAIAQAAYDVYFKAKPSYSQRVVGARAELLIELATLTGEARLFRTAKRISSVIEHAIRFASSYALSSDILSDRMLDALYGEASDCRVPTLWPPQLSAVQNGLLSSPYYVVSAPTSSGKTFLAELKIATYLDRKPNGLAIYVAPYNALAKQVGDALTRRFRTAGIAPALVWTGTYEIDHRELGSASLLVTTPEKLDGIVRSASEENGAGLELRRRAGLFVFDELHLIASPNRGVTYELLVTRLRRLFPTAEALAMSAVCDNAPSLTRWFAERHTAFTKDNWAPTRRRVLIYKRNGEMVSPAQVSQYKSKKWSNTGDAAATVATQLLLGGAGPTLILCTQVRYAMGIAKKLTAKQATAPDPTGTLHAAALEIDSALGSGSMLGSAVKHGVAYHYRGLPERVKILIEDLARQKLLQCVCSTTTLAEGIHLPFRSLIVPYFNFGGPEFINRSLLKNIVGRAGRAEVNLKATVIFMEPNEGPLQSHFYKELIARLDDEVEVQSVLPGLLQPKSNLDDFQSTLRLEAQILGAISDDTLGDDGPAQLAEATFAAQTHLASTRRLLTKKFEAMERRDPPLLTRNSPYALTGFGKAAAVSGISDSSGRVLIRELDHLFSSGSRWFEFDAWVSRPVPDELIDDIASLIVTPFEFFQSSSHGQSRRMEVVARAREWFKRRDKNWISATTPDRFVFRHWLKGSDPEDILRSARLSGITSYPFDEESDVLGLAHLQEYLEETRDFSLWMLSAAIRLSEQYCRERSITPEPIFRKAAALFEHGVSSDVALRLIAFGLPRPIVTRVSDDLFAVADEEDEVFMPSARRATSALFQREPALAEKYRSLVESLLS